MKTSMRSLTRVPGEAGSSRSLILLILLLAALPAFAAPPANDSFANAAVLTTGTPVTGDNTEATMEAGEPSPEKYDGIYYARTVWWNWTAPASGNYEMSTIGSDFDTILAVWTGNAVNALTLVKEDDDHGPGLISRLRFNAVGGAVYRIALAGYGEDEAGRFRVRIFPAPPPPPNDNFASRLPLTTGVEWTGTLDAATRETGEPDPPLVWKQDTSVWFTWTAPASGWFEFVQNDYYNITVWTGSELSGLRYLHGATQEHGETERILIKATAGTVYQISLGLDDGEGFVEDSGSTLVVRPAAEPGFQVTAFSLSRNSVDVSAAEQVVTAVFTVKGGGLPQQYAALEVEGTYFHRSIGLTDAHLISGTPLEGTYSVPIPVQRGLDPDQLWFGIWWGNSELSAGFGRAAPFLTDAVPSLEILNSGPVDNEGGTLLSAALSPASADITETLKEIAVTVRASDALSGVMQVNVDLYSSLYPGSDPIGSITLDASHRTSGTAQDGTYSGSLPIRMTAQGGTYFARVRIQDFNNNSSNFNSNEEDFPGPYTGFITVIRKERIHISSFAISPDPGDVSAGAQEVTATFRAVAVADGEFYGAWMTFDADGLPGGVSIPEFYIGTETLISGDGNDGIHQVKFTIPAGMPPGALLPRMEVYYLNEGLDFNSGEIHGWAGWNSDNPVFSWPAGIQQTLRVVNAGAVDTQAPALTALSLPSNVMKRENSSWTLHGTVTITDHFDASPVLDAFLTDAAGESNIGYADFSPNPDGTLEMMLTVYTDEMDAGPYYLAVETTDAVGNRRVYISNQADFPGPFKGEVLLPSDETGGYADWREVVFDGAAAANPAVSGETADPDGDGVGNLMEYALGLSPVTPDAGDGPALVREGANVYFRYTRSMDRPDLTFTVLAAETPAGPWSPASLSLVSTVVQGSRETLTLAVPAAGAGTGRGFLRLQVIKL